MPLAIRSGRGRLDGGRRELAEVDRLALERETSCVDARDEEDVVDEPVEAQAVAVDDLQEVLLLVLQLAGLAVDQELEVADHRRQRRAQLVRDGADELVLHAVELDQPGVLLGEGPPPASRSASSRRSRSMASESCVATVVSESCAGARPDRLAVGDELGDLLASHLDGTVKPCAFGLGPLPGWTSAA